MRAKKLIFLMVMVLSFAFFVYADDIPQGFKNIREADRFKKAWANQAMLVTPDSFSQKITGDKGYCFEFRHFADGSAVILKTDGTKEMRNGETSISEFIAVDSPGYENGDYALWFGIPGLNLNFGFKNVINPTDQTFIDTRGDTYEIKPGGYCSSLQ